MQLKTTVQITVVDIITARVVARRRFLSRSYVLQFLDGLYDHMTQTTHNIRDVTNALRSVTPFTWYMNANAVDDDDDFGLVVGTGETAVALADYKLETKIVHGVGAGQPYYRQRMWDLCPLHHNTLLLLYRQGHHRRRPGSP